MSAEAVGSWLASVRGFRVLLAFIVAAGAFGGWAPPARSEDLSFEAARTVLLARSDKLKAAAANINRQEIEVKAVETLGYPELTLNATEVYGRKTFDLSALPIGVSAYDYNFDGPRSSLLMTWPIYTGGKIGAAQKLREAELTGAWAELSEAEERLGFQPIARHFGLRLATIVEGLRQTQLDQAERQLACSRRFEAQGQISAVERLSAQARITFNQNTFDLLCSDLDAVPLARAAAASSAVQGVFAPVGFDRFAGSCAFDLRASVERVLGTDIAEESTGRMALRDREFVALQDGVAHRHMNLVDGGLSTTSACARCSKAWRPRPPASAFARSPASTSSSDLRWCR